MASRNQYIETCFLIIYIFYWSKPTETRNSYDFVWFLSIKSCRTECKLGSSILIIIDKIIYYLYYQICLPCLGMFSQICCHSVYVCLIFNCANLILENYFFLYSDLIPTHYICFYFANLRTAGIVERAR